jgi:hypothetical protein
MNQRWMFEVIQDGLVVAEGSGPDRQRVTSEANHYVMMYSQDGPVNAVVRKPGEKQGLAEKRRLLALPPRSMEERARQMLGLTPVS